MSTTVIRQPIQSSDLNRFYTIIDNYDRLASRLCRSHPEYLNTLNELRAMVPLRTVIDVSAATVGN